MVKRVILGRTGEEKIVDLIRAIDDKVSAGHTRPAGTKVLDWDEDMIWSRPDGTAHSVRDIDEELLGAQDRINDAEQSLADSQVRLEEAEQQIQTTQSGLDTLENETLPAAVQALEEADAAAQEQFTELDTRLGAFATDEALAPIRQALTDAQTAVEAAQGVAESANQAANAASQAALEAAGIAASKGRVIIQETEPVGEDRNAANIWIKPIPDDPETEIEEKAITYVYLEGSNEWIPTSSDELAQAAQNALDAREAAQQATQRAETAISNAAAAQSAAEAAQRTADDATLDAREAHNEAVAAADQIRAKIDAGESLILNGSFEDGDLGWPAGGSQSGRSRIFEDPEAHTGAHSLELTPTGANVYPESDLYTVRPGGVLYFRAWVKRVAGEDIGVRLLTRHLDGNRSALSIKYATNSGGAINEWGAADLPLGEWVLLEGDVLVPDNSQFVRVAVWARSSVDAVLHADDLFLLDVTDARAAQARADAALTEASEAKGLAEEAVREVGDTVRDTVIEYAVNTSETVAPTSGWSTSTPTRTPGSFVWMRTIVTYADGDTSTTSPALLTGNAGATGAKGSDGAKGDKGDKGDRGTDGVVGKDGVGLSSTALAYALSTSGTTAPSSGWTAAPPTPVKGRYLWTRTIWTYTDTSTETGYSVAYLATDGNDGANGVAGKDGVGISSTAITYAASSSGTTAPSSGWSSQPPAASAGEYVWTRTIWTYTDDSTETGYSVGKIGDTGSRGAAGAKGDKGDTGAKGATGAQGVSVSSVTPFFRTVARTAGAPAQPSGMTPSGWSTTEPAWSSNTKLYRAERIVYSNGVVSWTVPTLVAAYEGIVQVQTSVNGKNSITRSTSNASGSGVVAGDAWYKVDGNGDTMAMWIWSGSAWVASKVRNEMIDTIDVNKLKVHDSLEVVGDAVIEKLWADGIAAKAITAQQVTVAPGNSFPDPGGMNVGTRNSVGGAAWAWHETGRYWYRSAIQDGTTQFNAYLNTTTGYDAGSLTPGATYRIAYDVWVDGSTASTKDLARAAIYYRKTDGSTSFVGDGAGDGDLNANGDPIPTSQWTHVERTWVAPSDAVSGGFGLQLLYTNGSATQVRIRNPYVGVKAGAVLIEDGAITTPKLTVTGDMSAAIVNAMTTNTKKLVVTEEAILNHATLIGQAVVNDINIQGKLIGRDGVFIGTVDFANINVTGDVLADRISGEYLYGTEIEGGTIYTSDSGYGQVTLSDTAFRTPTSSGSGPGLSFTPGNPTGFTYMPGLGPIEGGMQLSGGRGPDGMGYANFTDHGVSMRWQNPTGSESANMAVYDGAITADFWGPSRWSGFRVDDEGVEMASDAASIRARQNYASITAPNSGLNLSNGQASLGAGTASVNISNLTSTTTVTGKLEVSSNIYGKGRIDVDGAFAIKGNGGIDGNLYYYGGGTNSRSANLTMQSGGGVISRSTSSRRYKKNIVDWNPDAERVLALRPRQWQHGDPDSPIDETWRVGFVAEEVHDLGLKGLVEYAGDGKGGWRPESLNYDRFAAAQQVVLKKHEDEIIELRERIALLEAQIGTQ